MASVQTRRKPVKRGRKALSQDERLKRLRSSSSRANKAAAAAENEIVRPSRLHHSRRAIRKECDARLERFLFECFPDAWSIEPGELHYEMIAEAEQTIRHGRNIVVAAPRGTGKTAIVARAALWGILRGRHGSDRVSRYICLIAANEKMKLELISIIKAELLKADSRLSQLYPIELHGLKHLAKAAAPQLTARLLTCEDEKVHCEWKADRVQLPLIPGSVCGNSVISACTLMGGDIRGQKMTHHGLGREIRPDTVVIDDAQTEKSSRSPPDTDARERTIIQGVAGMVGPGESLAMFQTVTVIQPHDLAERILDPQRNTDWRKIRRKLMPKDVPSEEGQSLWETYLGIFQDTSRPPEERQQHCTAFYLEHRAAMDAGLKVTWPARYEAWQAGGIQFAMHTKLTRPDFFQTEMQNEPQQLDSEERCEVLPEQVQQKPNGRQRYLVPPETAHIATGVDVHEDVLYWLTLATSQDFQTLQICDYGTFPDQGVPYFRKQNAHSVLRDVLGVSTREAAIFQGLEQLLPELLGQNYLTEFGVERHAELIGIDAGHKPKIVHNAIAGMGDDIRRLIKFKGQGLDAKDPAIGEKFKSKSNRGLWFSQSFGPLDTMYVDANGVKEFLTRRLAIEKGSAGSLEIFGRPNEHRMLAEHLAESEQGILSLAKKPNMHGLTAKWIFQWVPGRDNHFLDCLVIALSCLNRLGCAPPELMPKVESKPETDWAAQAQEEARKASRTRRQLRDARHTAISEPHF